jgi:hypothetical protein
VTVTAMVTAGAPVNRATPHTWMRHHRDLAEIARPSQVVAATPARSTCAPPFESSVIGTTVRAHPHRPPGNSCGTTMDDARPPATPIGLGEVIAR